ncbi:NUDIX hydrolase [Tranquillimonas alkanivorans]|uniref:8-oxo-dGTP pyrophosphatase MutT, NUDIX family n=1 Tax=Tranquillimonas alkanivorans TaxID=441119 RepID=A0A1I5Q256_9RHOB|nr:NUDIX hydrolase [Tranquillimonas alkanivorans]SFP40428.1 8-oxo-dGTP pyrophosphatase MutT, NUDIX family [Tranquillimonas alkanivorans]
MTSFFKRMFFEYIRPIFLRPSGLQVAALCHRSGTAGPEILLITSRDTGRWVLPKGWPMRGQDAVGAATIEAWEEAGVRPRTVGQEPIGSYRYRKKLRGGVPVTTRTLVFPIEVEHLEEDFPQKDERERRWVAPTEAARMVKEPELRDLLAAFRPSGVH